VVDTPTGPFWQLLRSPVVALRELPRTGPPPRLNIEGPTESEVEAKQYAPHRLSTPAPTFASLLEATGQLPADANRYWIEFASKDSSPRDRLIRMTDLIGARWISARRSLMVVGYEDYFRGRRKNREDCVLTPMSAGCNLPGARSESN
jgi:hypothetical protein